MQHLRKLIAVLLLSTPLAFAQNTTTLTGTVIDSDSQAWINAAWTATPVAPTPGKILYTDGSSVPASFSGTLNTSGVFSGSVGNVRNMQPAGVVLKWIVCSVTSAPCSTFTTDAQTGPNGSSYNMGAFASANIHAPRIQAAAANYAYNATEIINPTQGSGYTRTSDETQWFYNGVTYVQIAGGGGTVPTMFVSQLGCATQDGSFQTRTGTDDAACINTYLATASATHAVAITQDKVSAISGIHAPGNFTINGLGGGFGSVVITGCSVSGNVATFTTKPNTLTAGWQVNVGGFWGTACGDLENARLTVLSTGLTSTSFKANFTHADIANTNVTGTAAWLTGTGFVMLASAENTNNGIYIDGQNCNSDTTQKTQHTSSITLSNFVYDGNGSNGNPSTFCMSVVMGHADNVTMDRVTLYDPVSYNFLTLDSKNVRVINSSVMDSFPGIHREGAFHDGLHIDGTVDGLFLTNDYLHTDDDPLALNANEGPCGVIQNVYGENVRVDDSVSMIRMDTQAGVTCSDGTQPFVQHVFLNNYSGTFYNDLGFLGDANNPAGSSNVGIDDVNWSNSTATGPSGFSLVDNVGSLMLAEFTWIVQGNPTNSNPLGAWFGIANTSRFETIDNLKMFNVEQRASNWNPSGGAWNGLSRGVGGGSGATFNNLTINGYQNTCPDTATNCNYPVASFIRHSAGALTVTNALVSNFDTTNITAFDATGDGVTNYKSVQKIFSNGLIISDNNAVGGFQAPLQFLMPNALTGTHISVFFGQGFSTNNTGVMSYIYNGAGSTTNEISFGVFGNNDLLTIDAAGNVNAATALKRNGIDVCDANGNHCPSGLTGTDYYWSDTSCSNGVGQPVQCVGTTTLPGNMPDANYEVFVTTNSNALVGDYQTNIAQATLPTASGSTITYRTVQVMQNGGSGGAPTLYFHAHHN